MTRSRRWAYVFRWVSFGPGTYYSVRLLDGPRLPALMRSSAAAYTISMDSAFGPATAYTITLSSTMVGR